MIATLIPLVQNTARDAAKTAALGLFGAIFLGVGLLFLTLAGWLFLMSVTSALTAALVFGLMYLGIGLVLFGVISYRSRARRRARLAAAQSAAAAAAPTAAVTGHGGLAGFLIAFATGLAAAQKMRR